MPRTVVLPKRVQCRNVSKTGVYNSTCHLTLLSLFPWGRVPCESHHTCQKPVGLLEGGKGGQVSIYTAQSPLWTTGDHCSGVTIVGGVRLPACGGGFVGGRCQAAGKVGCKLGLPFCTSLELGAHPASIGCLESRQAGGWLHSGAGTLEVVGAQLGCGINLCQGAPQLGVQRRTASCTGSSTSSAGGGGWVGGRVGVLRLDL